MHSDVNQQVGGSSAPRSEGIVFCFDFDCMFVRSCFRSKILCVTRSVQSVLFVLPVSN